MSQNIVKIHTDFCNVLCVQLECTVKSREVFSPIEFIANKTANRNTYKKSYR